MANQRKLPVRVHRGGLSGRYYAITNYKVIDAERDLIEARTKHDVTADVEWLIAERQAESRRMANEELHEAVHHLNEAVRAAEHW